MHLLDYQQYLPAERDTILKVNLSWQTYYPGCSTAPWQLEGVVKTMLRDGYRHQSLIATHNSTVVVDSKVGEVNNKHLAVEQKYGLRRVHLNEPGVEWIKYEPKEPLMVLDKVYPKGIFIPKILVGKNVLHLPTVKTHVFTTITGAVKNAFGGLLHFDRHWTHSVIHEAIVDLLAIQKDIHTGMFAVMDGTIAGDGPGPRAFMPHIKNVILASNDMVAIDAIEAKLMGFEPLSIKFISLAHDKGLGVGDPGEIEIVGDDISNENWHFDGHKDTFASRGQKLIYWGPLKPLEGLLLRSPIVPWAYLASRLYHDVYWYPVVGRQRAKAIMASPWGKMFERY